MDRRWQLLLFLLVAYVGWQQWHNRPVAVKVTGMLAPAEPQQENLAAREAPSFQVKDYSLKAQARYRLEARLLGKEPYWMGREADLSPLDFALGWGPMSSNSLLGELEISQSNRFYHLRWQQLSVPSSVVMQHSANTHLIPASTLVKKQLDAMRPGQVVALSGYLVNASAPDGWHWDTSLTRNDTGAGACELFWVETAAVVGP